MVEFEYALNLIEWDIIGLAEIRRNSEEYVETREGHVFCHGVADNSNLGVGFLINKKWKEIILHLYPPD